MKNMKRKLVFLFTLLLLGTKPIISFAISEKNTSDNKVVHPMIAHKLYEKAKANKNWKSAFITGKHHQVVFMNISPSTNPKNEIGMETHPFDQIILIVEGKGKTDLAGEISEANAGDMIFIPQGMPHNVINLSQKDALKIISFYSDTDIPAHSIYKTKETESKS